MLKSVCWTKEKQQCVVRMGWINICVRSAPLILRIKVLSCCTQSRYPLVAKGQSLPLALVWRKFWSVLCLTSYTVTGYVGLILGLHLRELWLQQREVDEGLGIAWWSSSVFSCVTQWLPYGGWGDGKADTSKGCEVVFNHSITLSQLFPMYYLKLLKLFQHWS